MKAKVIKTGKNVDVISIIDRLSGCFISYWDNKIGKDYSRFELDFNVNGETNDDTTKHIDWEQRRYEIARDIMATSFYQPMEGVSIAPYIHNCVQWADALIEELKRQTNGENNV